MHIGHFSVNEKSVYANSPQITISGKYKNLMDENISARHNPGPGAYNPNHITKIPDIRSTFIVECCLLFCVNLDFKNLLKI